MDEEKDSKKKEGIIGEESSKSDDEIIRNSSENDATENNKINIKQRKYIVICLAIGFIISLMIIINSTVSKYDNLVYPGNKLYGKDISKLSKDEVIKEINNIENIINNKNIILEASKKEYTIKINEFIKSNNKEELSNEIIGIEKDKNILQKYIKIISKNGIDYKMDIQLDENKIKEVIKSISLDVNKKPIEPFIIIDGDSIKYKEGIEGLALNEDEVLESIKNIITNISEEGDIKISAIFEKIEPTIKIEDLKKVDTKISIFSTYYGGKTPRGTNIEVAAQKIDNLLIMPGEEFSYENSIGPVSSKNGYKEASVIVNGKIQNGIGGGVCQVSSTLYNAQLKAGILPTERRNHSKAVAYVPRGLDATLATGSIDYKFKNTYEYPLVINTYTSNGNVFIEIWSNKDATNGITYEPISYVSGKKAESYLYGYDKNGKKVFEQFIDTSIYR